MADKRRAPQRRRITEEQVREMMRLRRQGESIKGIAQAIGCHRQTVRLHLKEKRGDMLRDEARKEILMEAIRNHFKELADFAGKRMKRRFEESYPEKASTLQRKYLGGLFGLPGIGSSSYMVGEWERMHELSSRERHLIQALKEHMSDSPLWPYWTEWQREISQYAATSRDVRDELNKKIEEIYLTEEPKQLASLQKWLFGNALRRASGQQYEELEIVKRQDWDELICGDTVIGQVDHGEILRERLFGILKEPQNLPVYSELQDTMKELEDLQPKLGATANEMNSALDALSMMYGFPGRCHLCPI